MKQTLDPMESIKKAFLIGLGATAITIDKVQDLVNELVERGELTQKEAQAFGDDLKTRAIKEKDEIESKTKAMIEQAVERAIKRLGLVTQKDLDQFKQDLIREKNLVDAED